MTKLKYSAVLLAAVLAAAGLHAQEIEKVDTLDTSYVTAVREKMRNTTQTGLTRLEGEKLRSGVALFGTPDIIKSLQMLPGVAAGNELMSGLYVHGGDGTDNLFLLDGVPLYNISHFGGLFSSFNTDVVSNLDFYKSGFPARYGGRLSSVVDVETSEGDMREYHGNLSLGLIDGRLHLEGPIVKDKTSFNVGLRRSWLDLLTRPALLYANYQTRDSGLESSGGYAMSDFNARVTHKFSPRSKAGATFYWGEDNLKAGFKDTGDAMDMNMRTIWGTLAASAFWEYTASRQFSWKMVGYYSQSSSDVGYTLDSTFPGSDGEDDSHFWFNDDNICRVSDSGVKFDADWHPWRNHHVRTGATAIYHRYMTSRGYESKTQFAGMEASETDKKDGMDYNAVEGAAYLEDEIFLAYNFSINAGVRLALFGTGEKIWATVEPRAAMKWMIYKDLCAKLSYTRMSQNAHLVSAMYIDLPTNSWMPSRPGAGPMISDQVAGGLYFTPGKFRINLEGWYKNMDNILAYNGSNLFYPPLVDWEKSFTAGRGWSYGMELETTFKNEKLELSAFYTLSRSWRQFDAYYAFPFLDRFDNLHKLNLTGTWDISPKFSVYLNWNFHSGNRITIPSHILVDGSGGNDTLYSAPYNNKLPDYHRLDAGADYHIITPKGRRLNFNLSVYNVYNRVNPSIVIVSYNGDNTYSGKSYGLVPIIPSLSASITF